MAESFVVYIDESGDEGFTFGRDNNSSEWFVLSAAITKKSSDVETVKLVDEAKQRLDRPPNKQRKPLHCRDLRHEQRLLVFDLIRKAELKIVNILIHKPSLRDPETFNERYRLYFYGVRMLLERVSWYCRDHKTSHDTGDGSARLEFSNRSGMSYKELKGYLELLETKPTIPDMRIDWNIIKATQVNAFSPGKRMGLQIADAVAYGFFSAVNPTRHGFIEPRYVHMMDSVIYRHKAMSLGYGIKFFPWAPQEAIKRYDWLQSV